MTQFELLSIVVAIAGVAINLVLFVLFALQLLVLRRQVESADIASKEDHERRKKQATLEVYAATLEKRASIGQLIPDEREAGRIAKLIEDRPVDDEIFLDVMDYLGVFELMATGVNTDVFDLEVVERVASGRIRAMATNWRPFIEQRRALLGAPKLFSEIVTLAETLEERAARA